MLNLMGFLTGAATVAATAAATSLTTLSDCLCRNRLHNSSGFLHSTTDETTLLCIFIAENFNDELMSQLSKRINFCCRKGNFTTLPVAAHHTTFYWHFMLLEKRNDSLCRMKSGLSLIIFQLMLPKEPPDGPDNMDWSNILHSTGITNKKSDKM